MIQRKIKALLCAMTGLGNNILNTLVRNDLIDLVAAFTSKRPPGPFPYYDCPQLQELAEETEIPCFAGMNMKSRETCELVGSLAPDLIVVGSFGQILPRDLIKIPRYGVINVHPSLLPEYRGATPTVWALVNGEEKTGVTIHYIEDEGIDSGRIITQASLAIEPEDTDGILRYRLSLLAGGLLDEAISLVLSDSSTFTPQDESKATYFPKRKLSDAQLDLSRPFREISNRIRAMTPYPGAFLREGGTIYTVDSAVLLDPQSEDLPCNERALDVRIREGVARFSLVKERNPGKGS